MYSKALVLMTVLLLMVTPIIAADIALDTNENGKEDRWMNIEKFRDWRKLDVNSNDIADESCFYVSPKNQVYIINTETLDYSGDGKADIFISNTVKGKVFYREIQIDSNSDGKADLIRYEENDKVYLQKSDVDFDGVYELKEEYEGGQRVREFVDSNNDGRYDDTYHYQTDRLILEELDTDYDKKTDMWVSFEYEEDNSIKETVIKKDNNRDGSPDEWHYTNKRRQVIRIEKDTDFDGKVDSIKKL
jgi:hypothetical protein